jgi:hypothetical protein
LRVRDDEIDDHRRAAGESCRGAAFEILTRDRSHERQLHVRVWVDAARHYVLAAGIDNLRARRCIQVFADCLNYSVRAQHVCAPGTFCRYNCPALD